MCVRTNTSREDDLADCSYAAGYSELEFPNDPSRFGLMDLVFVVSTSTAFVSADAFAFSSGKLTLHGVLYKPDGNGPFPAVIFNH
jgi:hypothetical protein